MSKLYILQFLFLDSEVILQIHVQSTFHLRDSKHSQLVIHRSTSRQLHKEYSITITCYHNFKYISVTPTPPLLLMQYILQLAIMFLIYLADYRVNCAYVQFIYSGTPQDVHVEIITLDRDIF